MLSQTFIKPSTSPGPAYDRLALTSSLQKATPAAPDEGADCPADDFVRCAQCKAKLTSFRERVKINGSQTHTFFNPAGVLFEISCFRHVPGVYRQGHPSAAFSWFSGYQWQLVHCSRCQIHLGWYFSGTYPFHGLITPRIRQ